MPPRKGADLECLLSCEDLTPAALPRLLERLGSRGFSRCDEVALLAYGANAIEPTHQMTASQVGEFVDKMESCGSDHCHVLMCGALANARADLSMTLDFAYKVVSLDVLEGVIWHYTGDPLRADLSVLRAFAACCRAVIEEIEPRFGIIGSEPKHRDEMRLSVALQNGAQPVDEHFLSEKHVLDLFDWYTKVYAAHRDSIPDRG